MSLSRRMAVECVGVRRVSVSGKVIRIARVADEWYEDVDEPGSIVEGMTKAGVRADIFSFWQRLPNTQPRFHYHMEWDSIAALPVTSYRQWVETQINAKTRNLLVKAKKKGLIVKKAIFDDDFVRGMADVFNETPVRQGKPFWHYGKSVETIRTEFSRYPLQRGRYRSVLAGQADWL